MPNAVLHGCQWERVIHSAGEPFPKLLPRHGDRRLANKRTIFGGIPFPAALPTDKLSALDGCDHPHDYGFRVVGGIDSCGLEQMLCRVAALF